MTHWLAGLIIFLCALPGLAADEFEFDSSSYEKKPYELGGYLEFKPEYLDFNQDGAFYQLNFPDDEKRPSSDDRYAVALELEGLYRFGLSSMNFRGHAEIQNDHFGTEHDASFFELYYSRRGDQLSFELGKRALKWGKGYAWNPVGFVERRKDPGDPELSREGFIVASMDYVRSFDGPLQTLAFSPVLVPVTSDINEDFSAKEDLNLAGKLYLLYHDTDIDFLFLTEGSSIGRIGVDFSRNVRTNFEVHGELAWVNDQSRKLLGAGGELVTVSESATSYLLGLRYLTAQDMTWILEYYHNGSGFSEAEYARFFDLVTAVEDSGDPTLLNQVNTARNAGFSAPNPMRDYLYLRVTQKEPFDIVYLNFGFTSILNLQDDSYSLIPELGYTGYKNTELRLRAALTNGNSNTEFGEKQNESRLELRVRYFF